MRGLVATHGGIAKELVQVVEMIMGPGSGLDALSNYGKSAPDLTGEIKAWLQGSAGGDHQTGGDPSAPAILFIDDLAGSCATSARLASVSSPQVAIVSGVNLAMLLGFVTWREELDFDELVQRLVDKGRNAIGRLGGTA